MDVNKTKLELGTGADECLCVEYSQYALIQCQCRLRARDLDADDDEIDAGLNL